MWVMVLAEQGERVAKLASRVWPWGRPTWKMESPTSWGGTFLRRSVSPARRAFVRSSKTSGLSSGSSSRTPCFS